MVVPQKVLLAALAVAFVRSAGAACGPRPGNDDPPGGGVLVKDRVLRGRQAAFVPAPPPPPETKPTSPIVPSLIAAVGYKSFCMVVAGDVRCWGDDANGVLGYTHDQASDYYSFYENSTSYVYSTVDFTCNVDSDPAMVPAVPFGPNHSRAVEVVGSAASGGACARFENGGVKCWGHNYHGAAGQGSSQSFIPVEDIPTMPYIQFANSSSGRPTLAAQLVSANRHRCILSTEHEVHCWGQNPYGVLGYGDTRTVGTVSRPVAAAGAVPLWGEGETKPVQVVTTDTNTCVLMNDGTVGCWGDQSNHRDGTSATSGRIGDQPNEVCNVQPLNFLVPGGGHVVSIHGEKLHVCAVLSDGTSTCWGYNAQSSLGLDSSQSRKRVDNGRIAITPAGTSFKPMDSTLTMATGLHVTCAIGRAGGAALPGLKCWGWGSSARLAQNDTRNYGDAVRPVASAEFINFGAQAPGFAPRQVAIGTQSVCALLAARDLTGAAHLNETVRALEDDEAFAVRCWGRNRGCALGVDGSSSNAYIGYAAGASVASWKNSFDFQGVEDVGPLPRQDDTPTTPAPPTNNNNDDAPGNGQGSDDGAAGGSGGASASNTGAAGSSGMGGGAIAGVVIGIIAAVAIVAGVVLWKRGAFARAAAPTPAASSSGTAAATSGTATTSSAGQASSTEADAKQFAGNNPMTDTRAAGSA